MSGVVNVREVRESLKWRVVEESEMSPFPSELWIRIEFNPAIR